MGADSPKGVKFIQNTDLPYLSHAPRDGRGIVVAPYYDADEDCVYAFVGAPDGRLAVMRPGRGPHLIDGVYVAKRPADPERDVPLPLSDIMIQHLSFPGAMDVLSDVESDLVNALASLHKYFILLLFASEHRDHTGHLTLSSEIECAFGNHRAFYDRVHDLISVVHARCRSKAPTLPSSFEKMLNKTDGEMREVFLFPNPLVAFYRTTESTFRSLRDIRNNIFHHGHQAEWVFEYDDGFGVSIEDKLVADLGAFNLWPEGLLKPNRIGSVLAVFEFLTRDIFETMKTLGASLLACFDTPPPAIAAGHQAYFRSRLAQHLVSLDEYRRRHWLDPRGVLTIKDSG